MNKYIVFIPDRNSKASSLLCKDGAVRQHTSFGTSQSCARIYRQKHAALSAAAKVGAYVAALPSGDDYSLEASGIVIHSVPCPDRGCDWIKHEHHSLTEFLAPGSAEPVKTVRFVVVAVSSNRNSFGLAGVVIVAENGEAFEIGMSSPPQVGFRFSAVLKYPETTGVTRYGFLAPFQGSFEIPRTLPTAPAEVLKGLFS